jgi:DNA adenine methylase
MFIKPFFGRIGSKHKYLKHIMEYIPEHKIYCEPFVGGGSVFWNKKKVDVEIINDLDKNLIEGYNILKDVDVEEILKLKITRGELSEEDLLETIRIFVSEENKTPEHLLLKTLYMTKNTFGASGLGKIYKPFIHEKILNNIDFYKERLIDTEILNLDYKDILSKYDSPETFFYLDPPYEKSKGLYKNEVLNLNELEEVLKTLKGKWMLSLNDSENVREIFKDYNIRSFYTMEQTNRIASVGTKRRCELIITKK